MKEEIIKFLEENFNLDNYELPDEYSYSCLPLCLLDAVFSIGANYKSTQNVVDRFCDINNLEKFKSDTSEDYTIKEFIDYIDKTDPDIVIIAYTPTLIGGVESHTSTFNFE